jgi:hypothetical protein
LCCSKASAGSTLDLSNANVQHSFPRLAEAAEREAEQVDV